MNLIEWLAEAEKHRNDRKLLPLLHLCNGWKISIQNSEGYHCLNGSGFEVLFREGSPPNYWVHMCEDPDDEFLGRLYVNVQFWMVEVFARECGGALPVFEKEERMTIKGYCDRQREDGYGVALLERGSGRIITPYCGSWIYSDNGMSDDAIEELEIDEYAITLNGRYMLQTHSGCYEEIYNEQENNDV